MVAQCYITAWLKQIILKLMQNYNTILAQFLQVGYSQSSALDEYEVNKALDKIYQKNTKNGEIFNREIAQEIFEQTPKNGDQEVIVRDYISTLLEAHTLLKKYVHQHRERIKMADDQAEREELMGQLQQYEEDYELLTEPFGIENQLKAAGVPDSRISKSSNMSEFFAESPKVGNQSQSLKIVLAVTLGCFVLEFLLMYEKHAFLSLLAYVAVLCIFLLNYFDKTYIRVTLYLLVVSVFLDFLWVLLQADHYWNPEGASHHSNDNTGFRRFVYIMTILAMVAKGVITYLLFKYRTNTPDTCKTARLFNFRFDLSAETPSPLSLLVEKGL